MLLILMVDIDDLKVWCYLFRVGFSIGDGQGRDGGARKTVRLVYAITMLVGDIFHSNSRATHLQKE